MNWVAVLAIAVAWGEFYGAFNHRRGFRQGWYAGYLARKFESHPGELWPEGVTEEEGMYRAKMLRRID